MRVLITGTRDTGAWVLKVDTELRRICGIYGRENVTVVHGDCPSGIDKAAQVVCEREGITSERHPADWKRYGKVAGPMRNQKMVSLGADIVLAFPKGASRGTRDCIERAVIGGLDVEIFEL